MKRTRTYVLGHEVEGTFSNRTPGQLSNNLAGFAQQLGAYAWNKTQKINLVGCKLAVGGRHDFHDSYLYQLALAAFQDPRIKPLLIDGLVVSGYSSRVQVLEDGRKVVESLDGEQAYHHRGQDKVTISYDAEIDAFVTVVADSEGEVITEFSREKFLGRVELGENLMKILPNIKDFSSSFERGPGNLLFEQFDDLKSLLTFLRGQFVNPKRSIPDIFLRLLSFAETIIEIIDETDERYFTGNYAPDTWAAWDLRSELPVLNKLWADTVSAIVTSAKMLEKAPWSEEWTVDDYLTKKTAVNKILEAAIQFKTDPTARDFLRDDIVSEDAFNEDVIKVLEVIRDNYGTGNPSDFRDFHSIFHPRHAGNNLVGLEYEFGVKLDSATMHRFGLYKYDVIAKSKGMKLTVDITHGHDFSTIKFNLELVTTPVVQLMEPMKFAEFTMRYGCLNQPLNICFHTQVEQQQLAISLTSITQGWLGLLMRIFVFHWIMKRIEIFLLSKCLWGVRVQGKLIYRLIMECYLIRYLVLRILSVLSPLRICCSRMRGITGGV